MAEYSLGSAALGTEVDLSGLKKGIDAAEGESQKGFGHVGGLIGGALKTGLMATAGGVIAAIGGIVSGVASNAEFERYRTQLGVMLGSTEAAEQRLQDLAEFGAKTPFELPEVVRADKVLQGFGLHSEEAAKRFGMSGQEIRTIAGDVASGTGESFENMALLLGKFSTGSTGEAISRMAELGITSREELSKLGLEFSKSGELLSPLPQSMDVILKLMKQKYGGMMDAQSSTFEGMVSNLQDWTAASLRTVSAPIFEVVKAKLGDLLTFLNDPATQAAIAGFAQALAEGVGQAITFITTTVIPAFQAGWATLQPALTAVGEYIIGTLWPTFRQIGDFIGQNLAPVLSGLAAMIIAVVVPAFIAWATTMLTVTIPAAIATITAMAPIILVVAAIGAAIALLVAAWQNDWGGIRTTLTAFWDGTGKPIFEAVRQWLAETLVAAIQTVSDFWTGTLQPALNAVWTFLKDNVIPIIQTLVGQVFAGLNAGTRKVSDFWTGTLQPALNAVWTFLKQNVIPILTALASVAIALVKKEVELLAALWTGVLQPALNAVWAFVQTNVIPILTALAGTALANVKTSAQAVSDFWTGTLQPAFKALGGIIGSVLEPAFAGLKDLLNGAKRWFEWISDAVSNVVDWLRKLADKINSIEIPDWLEGHSPPPLANWFGYIADSIGDVAGGLPALDVGLSAIAPTGIAPAGAAAGGGTQITISFNDRGMSWLRQFIDVEAQSVVDGASRRADTRGRTGG